MNKEYLIENLRHWDWESYGKENKDLRYISSSLLRHALNYGIKEGRTLKFDKKKNFLKHKDVNLVEYFNQVHKFFIIQPIHGLSNRLRAIASAYSICKELNKPLIINWIPDCHCDCKIEDLITNIDDLCVGVIDNIDTNKLKNMGVTFQRNYNDNPIIDHSKEKLYVESNSVLKNGFSNKYFLSFFNTIMFNNEINDMIYSIPNINEYIGMHIRMDGGKEYQSNDAEKESNWCENGKKNLFKYREISHIDNFINQINNILHKNPEQKFFIATDMKINYKKLIDIYGNDTIKILHRDLFDRSKKQIYYAIVDIILLSKCKQFYGSTWSSFSELVTYFQKTDVKKLNEFSNNFKIQNLSHNKNFFNTELKNGNSIVCVSMNQTDNILKALPFWLRVKDYDEIVLLDFGSTIPLTESLKQYTIRNKKLKIYRIDNVTKLHLSKAYNLVIKLTSYKNIYKLNSDDCCNENVIINHPLNCENVYYYGTWQHARNENELQIGGKIFFTYDLFVKTNGYNENITTYGWEDYEFDSRLNEIGIRKDINIDDFVFIEHGDDIGTTKGDLGLQSKHYIEINQRLCAKNILNWNKRSLHTDFIYDKKGTFYVNNKYHIEINFINKEQLTKNF